MIRFVAWSIAVLLHFGLPIVGGLGWVFAASDLPEVPRWGHGDVFVFPMERFNPLSLVQGSTEAEVDILFGLRPAQGEQHREDRCVRYEFRPRLSYTLLFRHGLAESMWLTEEGFVPYLCEGILVRSVKVTARPWYPTEAPRHSSACGCPQQRSSTCRVP